jgi:hypothetical protein
MNFEDHKIDRQWLLRYVLGELSQDETRAADERFFSDDSFASALDESYRDVLDDYATNLIQGAERERVESAFFSAADRGRRLSLLQAMQSPRHVAASAHGAALRKRRIRSSWPLAISACALAAAVALAVFIHTRPSRIARDRNVPDEAATATSAGQRKPELPAASTPASAESAFTILLLPGVTRGEQPATDFSIPRSAANVNFQIVLPEDDASGAAFAVRLSQSSGTELRFVRDLPARKMDGQTYVEFSVPSNDLPAGNYLVDVYASSAASSPIARFSVRLARSAARPPQP